MSRRSAEHTPPAVDGTPPACDGDQVGVDTGRSSGATPSKHEDEMLDQALADTFPASDPVSTLCCDAPPATDVDTHPPSDNEDDRTHEKARQK